MTAGFVTMTEQDLSELLVDAAALAFNRAALVDGAWFITTRTEVSKFLKSEGLPHVIEEV